ncbi:LytR/AlgR family response regulator transcription factor [Pseudomarimonas arenosa]|uniref:LytTR family transcriptional regulator DNA-binding domain-containing protein n=1 Tax=Pseudomarimonas arenosa TaxID=2774145 RepID=A0AAW3ZLR4_9GAMM|nr:LytTR family DNA-binding domain-containing protein [Pseudomarimonas arenosa]MBD8525607.1 LytTR family transcriptional regulator DNA-binding domain-containing protein [Pseudomarimonas arenosa]
MTRPPKASRWQIAWQRPYPLSRGTAVELGHSLAITVFALLLIWLTRPFGLGHLPASLADRLILELSAVCLGSDALLRAALPALWGRRLEAGWTCGREMLRTVTEIGLLACAVLAWLHLRTSMTLGPRGWLLGIAVTALCAAGPIALRVLLTERQLRAAHQDELERAARHSADSAASDWPSTLAIEASDGQLALSFSAFRYAEAEQNYVNVVWHEQNRRHQRLLRMTLSELEQQLARYPVFRCHRSFLISLPAVTEARGNAQGYQLNLRELPETVPVARSRLTDFRAAWAPVSQAAPPPATDPPT